MKNCASIIFLLLFGFVNAQKTDSLRVEIDSVKLPVDKLLEYDGVYEKSDLKQEMFNYNMFQQIPIIKQAEQSGKAMMPLQERKMFSIIVDPKEAQGTFADLPKITVAKMKQMSKQESGQETNNNQRIFGPSQFDSRIEPLQLTNDVDWQKKIIEASESVGILVEREKITRISNTLFQLDISSKLGEVFNLCRDEAFYDQPTTGVGTCFVFSEKNMLTASHVFERPLKNYVVVFGFKIFNKNGVVDIFVDKDNVYYPKAVVKKNHDLDIVEFSVDRKINRPILDWEESKNINASASEIYLIGFPSGLPMKIALNASITDNNHPTYYYTSLDCFRGNSGSPVFNFYTNKVIGVLVSGEIDYKFNGNCFNSPLCKYPYCLGEKVIRIEEIIKQF